MRQFYDMILLGLFIIIVCTFMLCCQKRTQRINERNAKIFEMRAASPGESELEYEDIQSSEMDNDNNDDIDLIEKQKKLKIKQDKRRNNKKKRLSKKQQEELMNKHNDIEVCVDSEDDNKSDVDDGKNDGDIFSDSTDDGMSMARMREEYYKSQTLTKKFTDLLDDIREILKSKQLQVQNKFIKKKPMIVIPMAMPSQSTINTGGGTTNTATVNNKNNNTGIKKKGNNKKSGLVLLNGNNNDDDDDDDDDDDEDEDDNDNDDNDDNHSVESECDEKVREEDD